VQPVRAGILIINRRHLDLGFSAVSRGCSDAKVALVAYAHRWTSVSIAAGIDIR